MKAKLTCTGAANGIIVLLLLALISCSSHPKYPEASRIGNSVVIDTTGLISNVPVFYSYAYNKVRINFFVVKLDDRVVSFLDACMKCYAKKLGFRYDNGFVICRSCNEMYPVAEIEKGFGSCYPIKIEGRQEGNRYMIEAETLERVGERFFK